MHLLAERLSGAVRALEILARHDERAWPEVARAARDASLRIAHAVSLRDLWRTLAPLDRAALMTARAEGDHLCHQIPPRHLKDRPSGRISVLVAELGHYGRACDRHQELLWPPPDPRRSDRHALSAEHLASYRKLPDRWRAGVLYILTRPEETPSEILRLMGTPGRCDTQQPTLDGLLTLAVRLAAQSGHVAAPTDDAPPLSAGYAARLAEQLDVLPAPWQRCVLMRVADGTRSHQALALIHSARSYYTHTYMPLTRRHQKPDCRRRKLFPREKGETPVTRVLGSDGLTSNRQTSPLPSRWINPLRW